jgi:hypothetical protein
MLITIAIVTCSREKANPETILNQTHKMVATQRGCLVVLPTCYHRELHQRRQSMQAYRCAQATSIILRLQGSRDDCLLASHVYIGCMTALMLMEGIEPSLAVEASSQLRC